MIKLERDHPKIVDKIEVEFLAVDGDKLLPVNGIVYKQRQSLSNNGVVSACLKIEKGTIKLLDFASQGIFENSE